MALRSVIQHFGWNQFAFVFSKEDDNQMCNMMRDDIQAENCLSSTMCEVSPTLHTTSNRSELHKRKRLHAICGVPEDSHRILDIEMKVLRACLRSKQDNLYAMLKKCAAKEYYCDQYLEGNLWRRIIGSEEGELPKRQLSNKV
ncbi:hypothetical protein KIN20_024712 [Parelaphostrongylus tenuis]|uniref:Receptor ligand binding region domain-containing protein n=1 Tax=Parelaphostrongylus tenuis TaxID=148309 RepID=A0AAD5MTW3_PARTN|nr:hypothetical protein KIN20_024712 [Parelaphostrongylus tenuis]